MGDKLILEGMTFYAYHGLSAAEQELGQRYVVDVRLTMDLTSAGQTDDIQRTIDYNEIYRRVESVVTGGRYHLLETIADKIAAGMLAYPEARKVKVRVEKPEPPIPGHIGAAAVELTRQRD